MAYTKRIQETFTIPALNTNAKLMIFGDSIGDACGKTVTAVGTAAVSTAQYKFSQLGRSILLDGDSDYLQLATSSDFYFGTGAFTLEGWFRFSSVAASQTLIGRWSGSLWLFYWYKGATNKLTYIFANQRTAGTTRWEVEWNPSVDTWYHIAVVRNGSSVYFFVNGSQVGNTITCDAGDYDYDNPQVVQIGAANGGTFFNGYISGVRITKGSALWTSNFTPPVYGDYGGARTYYVFSGLAGNTDIEYKLSTKLISGATNAYIGLQINNDTTADIYGRQDIYGQNTTTAAYRGTEARIYGNNTDCDTGEIGQAEFNIFAKSGYVRTILIEHSDKIATTTINSSYIESYCWNNTADEITSLVINGVAVNGLGVGTKLTLWKRASWEEVSAFIPLILIL